MSDKQRQNELTISHGISNFLEFIRNTQSQYRMAEAEAREADDTTQDILHSLELGEHTYHEYAQLSKQLKRVREQRRRGKDTAVVTAQVVEWAEKNATVIKDLEKLLGEIRKSEKNFANRLYTPKTNNVEAFVARTSGYPKGNVNQNKQGKKRA